MYRTARGGYPPRVACGGGKPLFRDLPDALRFEVVATTTYASGTALHLSEPP